MSDSAVMSVAEADALLTGPGGFFEIRPETINGTDMDVVATPHHNLRDLLTASGGHGGDGSSRYYLFDDGRSATFAENITHTAAVAAYLTERHGVQHGDRVALLGANQPAWIQGFWGAISTGAVAVAMNGWWKGDEIRHGLELTEPKVLIADRRRLERIGRDPGLPVIVMDDGFEDSVAEYIGAALPDRPIAPDDPAAILFTSGTTGRPKGAIQTHRNFLAYVSCAFMIGARKAVRFPADAAAVSGPTLACSPLFHVSGLHACAIIAVAAGSSHVWTTGRYDPEKILQLTQEHGIARWGGVTTQIWRLVEHPGLGEYDTSSVVSVGGGGSIWSPELQQACRAALPNARADVNIGYGLTESSGLATSAADDVLREHPDSVGYPLPTVSLRITDDDNNELTDGAIGNVCVKGPMVTPGYWNDPDATDATIRNGWLRTGDHGYIRDGLLFLAGRRHDLIIRGGENIYPAEIENRLDAHPDVVESAVIGVDHRELGQEVKAVVVLRDRPGSQQDTLHEGQHTRPRRDDPGRGISDEADRVTDEGDTVADEGDTVADAGDTVAESRAQVAELRAWVAELRAWVAEALADVKVPAHWDLRTEPLARNATGKLLRDVIDGSTQSAFVEE